MQYTQESYNQERYALTFDGEIYDLRKLNSNKERAYILVGHYNGNDKVKYFIECTGQLSQPLVYMFSNSLRELKKIQKQLNKNK